MIILGWQKKGATKVVDVFGLKFRQVGVIACFDIFGWPVFKKMGKRYMLFGFKFGQWHDK